MIKHKLVLATTFFAAAATVAPAFALNNPVVVALQATNGSVRAASATIFGSGSSVLVNVTGERAVPKGAAVTLNDGDCAKPGDVAFALSGFAENGSYTQLNHSLEDVAGKAKSMIIHQTTSATSPPFACGKVSG